MSLVCSCSDVKQHVVKLRIMGASENKLQYVIASIRWEMIYQVANLYSYVRQQVRVPTLTAGALSADDGLSYHAMTSRGLIYHLLLP